jgi:hypothetical protein
MELIKNRHSIVLSTAFLRLSVSLAIPAQLHYALTSINPAKPQSVLIRLLREN